MNAVRLFDAHERRAPGALALRWDTGTMTYGELGVRARRAAAVLAARGVRAEERVALLLPNDPAFAVALLATYWLGATAVVLSPAWQPADAARALADADARVLVTTQAAAAALGAELPETLLVDVASGARSFDAAIASAGDTGPLEPAPRRAGDAAVILFSSGTTGDPKGVVLSHGNLVFNAESKARYCGLTASDSLALVLPVAHCFGQNAVLLAALTAGASVRLYPRFDEDRLRAGIVAGEVSVLFAAPVVFQRLLDAGDPAVLGALRCSLSAAAPMSVTLARRWREATGLPLLQGYGLTESSPFAAFDDATSDQPGCVGRAIEGVEIRIGEIDGDGWMKPGELGEIAIRGPNVMREYWRRPEQTRRALRGGWLRSGDVGRLSPQGHLTLTDRLDDAINVAGFKVYPSDVERAVTAHPAVAEAAAYRVRHGARGWRVAVDVVLAPGMTLDAAGLHAFAEERLAGFQRPSLVRFVSGLPRSPSGKVLRRVLTASVHTVDEADGLHADARLARVEQPAPRT